MGRYLTTVIFACIFLAAPFLAAAEIEKQRNISSLFGTFSPKPGVWSEYAIFDKSTGKRSVMRMSIVDIAADAYWYEVENMEEDGSDIVKMLINGDPNDPDNILRLIMKSGVNPAKEMHRDSLLKQRYLVSQVFELQHGIPSSPTVNLKNIKTGVGSATVPAGTFDVSLHKIVDSTGKVYARYKFSEDVHPFGIVISEAENSTMILVGHGNGAKSRIREEATMITRPPDIPEGMTRAMPYWMRPLPDQRPGNTIQQNPGMGRGYEPKE